jgi:hypothetical protein
MSSASASFVPLGTRNVAVSPANEIELAYPCQNCDETPHVTWNFVSVTRSSRGGTPTA